MTDMGLAIDVKDGVGDVGWVGVGLGKDGLFSGVFGGMGWGGGGGGGVGFGSGGGGRFFSGGCGKGTMMMMVCCCCCCVDFVRDIVVWGWGVVVVVVVAVVVMWRNLVVRGAFLRIEAAECNLPSGLAEVLCPLSDLACLSILIGAGCNMKGWRGVELEFWILVICCWLFDQLIFSRLKYQMVSLSEINRVM